MGEEWTLLIRYAGFLLADLQSFTEKIKKLDDKDAFNRQPAGRRALTIAAGPVFNIIFAFILAILILTTFRRLFKWSVAEMYGMEVRLRKRDLLKSAML